jgi:hypothetical protein
MEDANPVRGACGSGVVQEEDDAVAVVRRAVAIHWNVRESDLTFLQVTRDRDDLLGLEPSAFSGIWL